MSGNGVGPPGSCKPSTTRRLHHLVRRIFARCTSRKPASVSAFEFLEDLATGTLPAPPIFVLRSSLYIRFVHHPRGCRADAASHHGPVPSSPSQREGQYGSAGMMSGIGANCERRQPQTRERWCEARRDAPIGSADQDWGLISLTTTLFPR